MRTGNLNSRLPNPKKTDPHPGKTHCFKKQRNQKAKHGQSATRQDGEGMGMEEGCESGGIPNGINTHCVKS